MRAETPTAATPEAETKTPESAPVWPHVMWHTATLPSGIAMVPYRTRRPVDQESSAEVIELWKKNVAMSAEEFYVAFDEKACADWSKMQPDGSSSGGAWDAPEGSAERRDAWETTRRANGEALAALPYPPETVLYAIDYLCARRLAGVDPRRGAVGARRRATAHPCSQQVVAAGGGAALFRRRV